MLFTSRFLQKQSPGAFYKKSSPYKFRNIYRKTPVLESLFNKVAGLQAKFLRTPILKNTCKRFLLKLKERNIKGTLYMISFHFSFCIS